MVDRDTILRAVHQLAVAKYAGFTNKVELGLPYKLIGSPIVAVLTGGSEHPPFTAQGNQSTVTVSTVTVQVNHFVARVNNANQNPRKAETQLNKLNWLLQELVRENRARKTVVVPPSVDPDDPYAGGTVTWDTLRFGRASAISPYKNIGGDIYELEPYELVITVFA